jgi:hypothetical protein
MASPRVWRALSVVAWSRLAPTRVARNLREIPGMTKLPALIVAALLGVACAAPLGGPVVAPGTSRDDVLARMGPPTRIVALPGGGQRLQYSTQPVGQQAWMVDLDAAGRVTGARQVLTERNFQRIVEGQWTRADVEREFGPPASVGRVGSWHGPIMTYRWRETGTGNMFYWVYLDPQGTVQRAHPGMEFRDRLFDFR